MVCPREQYQSPIPKVVSYTSKDAHVIHVRMSNYYSIARWMENKNSDYRFKYGDDRR